MFEVIFLERMEIEHLLRYLDAGKGDYTEGQSQLHRIRSRHIIRSRVRYWLNDIVDEMRKKSPASVQKWVDSIQIPTGAGTSTGAGSEIIPPTDQSGGPEDATVHEADCCRITNQLAAATVPESETDHDWVGIEPPSDGGEAEQEEDPMYVYGENGNPPLSSPSEHVLSDKRSSASKQTVSTTASYGLPAGPQSATLATSTPKGYKSDDSTKQAPVAAADGATASGLSIRSFLSKKTLLGKFSRSGSQLDQSQPSVGEGAPEGQDSVEDAVGAVPSSHSPFVVGKSKINEFYDKLNMNKAKYGLIKAKKLDIRNMLSGGGSSNQREPRNVCTEPTAERIAAPPAMDEFAVADEADGEARLAPESDVEVSVVDVDPSDACEFSFDESFPKSDELAPGMISEEEEEEEEEEKENLLDAAAYLNPPKPKAHRMGIGRIGRSSSENPRATARRYNLMEIGRSFSEMNDDDDSFAISECNNSCPNPSSLNTSSSINNGSLGNLTRSVPVSPIPRTASKLSIQQQQDPHHQQHPHQQHQAQQQQSSSPRRRSTMLVKDSSLQSDSSRCSSVESLLNARKPDPEKILLNLGFGPAPHSTDVLAKIPKRFLKPSQVRGVDTEAFLRQQQLSMHIHENSVLGYRGLVGNPHIPPSMIVAKIMERFQENDSKTRLTAAGVPLGQSDSRNSSGPPSPVPMTRHASLATADGRLKF
uniref:ITPR-interacting domain-containing protein n=1 Tax=Anopheles farauti TaxID=69004 RepID=A0A182QVJ3_9DIPT